MPRRTTVAKGSGFGRERGDQGPGEDLGGAATGRSADRETQARLFGAGVACVVGMLFAVGSVLAAFVDGSPGVSGGALGVGLGILGYFLGARSLATVFFGVAAVFLALAASQGLIPGIEYFDREMPG